MVGIGSKVSACAMKLYGWSAQSTASARVGFSYFVILSSIERSSSMKVGKVILDRSAPGRSCDMMCERTAE